MTAKKRQKLAIYRPEFTDNESVFVNFAVQHRGDGEHGDLVIAVALAEIILRAEAKASPDGRAAALLEKKPKGTPAPERRGVGCVEQSRN